MGAIYSWSLRNVKKNPLNQQPFGFPLNQYFAFMIMAINTLIVLCIVSFIKINNNNNNNSNNENKNENNNENNNNTENNEKTNNTSIVIDVNKVAPNDFNMSCIGNSKVGNCCAGRNWEWYRICSILETSESHES